MWEKRGEKNSPPRKIPAAEGFFFERGESKVDSTRATLPDVVLANKGKTKTKKSANAWPKG